MTPEPGNLPPRHRPPGQVAERPAAVRDLLAAHAAARERTADEHMFTVSSWNGARMGTFRLQLFTAPGTRPVAVATQGPAEGGRLADWAEDYAAEVWRLHFPDSAEPPVWITLQLSPGSREGRRPQRFSLVTFRLWEPYELSWPQRFAMTDATSLPWLVRQWIVTVVTGTNRGRSSPTRSRCGGWHGRSCCPAPRGVDRGCITAAAPWWRRLARQVIPLRTTRDCYYYHRVNWRQVSAVAIRVTRQARREGLVGEAFGDRVAVLAAAQGLPAREEEALADLLADHSVLQPGPRFRLRAGYTNGRHRTTAMLDVGVRRTIIVRWRYPS